MTEIKAILVDYGGVLAHHYCQPYQSMLANLLGVSLEESKKLISEKSDQGKLYRKGQISKTQFWDRVIHLSKASLLEIPYDDLQLLWAKTYIIDYRMLNLITILRKKVKVYLYSNMDKNRFKYVESKLDIKCFLDGVFCSFETKHIKPCKESVSYVLNKLKLSGDPTDVLVIDDRENTCKKVKQFGLQAYRYENYDNLLEFLFQANLLSHLDFY